MWRALNTALIVWGVAFGVFFGYWEVAEAGEPGRQFTDPLLPCIYCAYLLAAPIFFVEYLRRWRTS